ncbi:hypothetical protein [Leptospira sp. GIMC2001]|uniref:hypothetical protein n=1 Tax=Leptospira sp. GIMC2001 TaxID=1513297 RepID=UPI00234A88BF|nr:hypothetical protein [Leptospira sp. GIMC2001]WCL49270.1 hypothetical protein O4O04_18550 [Leptospira sp. GIMC2001]
MTKRLTFTVLFLFYSITPLLAEKLLLISDKPYVLDRNTWKYFFKNSSWKSNEILEADRDHLYIYLNSYKIPETMEWKRPSWGLWNLKENSFQPYSKIPSNLIPIRRVGNHIYLSNKNETEYSYYDSDQEKILKIQSSIKIRGWFPRADNSIAYIIEDEKCDSFKGSKKGKMWSICVMSSDLAQIEKISSIEPGINPMLTGDSDNFIVIWHKNLKDKVWILDSINLDNGSIKLITQSNHEDLNKQQTPFWLSWIGNNWIIYERFIQPTNPEANSSTSPANKEEIVTASNQKSYIAYNISSEKRKEILLDEQAELLSEPGRLSKRTFSYSPYLIVINYNKQDNGMKVIDVEELKVLLETKFPFEELKTKKPVHAVYHP